MEKLVSDRLNLPSTQEQIDQINEHIQKNRNRRGRYETRRLTSFHPTQNTYINSVETLYPDAELICMWDEHYSHTEIQKVDKGYNNQTHQYESSHHPVSQSMTIRYGMFFVSEDTEVARLNQQIQAERDQNSEVVKKHIDRKRELKSQIADLERKASRGEEMEKRYNGLLDQTAQRELTVKKYETDLSKIRQAIGEIKMNEILQS